MNSTEAVLRGTSFPPNVSHICVLSPVHCFGKLSGSCCQAGNDANILPVFSELMSLTPHWVRGKTTGCDPPGSTTTARCVEFEMLVLSQWQVRAWSWSLMYFLYMHVCVYTVAWYEPFFSCLHCERWHLFVYHVSHFVYWLHLLVSVLIPTGISWKASSLLSALILIANAPSVLVIKWKIAH